MANYKHMVDMTRSSAEKAEAVLAPIELPDVPYGLCISLSEDELEKLDLDDDCDVGDLIHLFAMAKVTSVSKNETANGCRCRVELSIIAMRVEDESTEEEPDDEEDD